MINTFEGYLEKARQIYAEVVEGISARDYAFACSEFSTWCAIARVDASLQQIEEVNGLEKTFRTFNTRLTRKIAEIKEVRDRLKP